MGLKIQNVNNDSFKVYGRVITGYDFSKFIYTLTDNTPAPENVVYVPSDAKLENEEVFAQLRDNVYGGMPIQAGYCNGTNTKLNCLEYHKDSEINIAASDAILLVARQQDAVNGIDSSKVEAFLVPEGTAVEVYATTLHYAPCSAKKGIPFRVAVILPKGTNVGMPEIKCVNDEDKRLFARNKWLIAHKDAQEAANGAVVGITGDNIDIENLI